MNLRHRVLDLVRGTLCRGKEFKLTDEDSFLDNGLIDSLGMLELVKALESAFHIHVDDDELAPENLDSIVFLVAYLQRKGITG